MPGSAGVVFDVPQIRRIDHLDRKGLVVSRSVAVGLFVGDARGIEQGGEVLDDDDIRSGVRIIVLLHRRIVEIIRIHRAVEVEQHLAGFCIHDDIAILRNNSRVLDVSFGTNRFLTDQVAGAKDCIHGLEKQVGAVIAHTVKGHHTRHNPCRVTRGVHLR